jgi:hypothetical protein
MLARSFFVGCVSGEIIICEKYFFVIYLVD